MAAPAIRLNAQQVEDFAALCKLGPNGLEDVLGALDSTKRPMINAADLRTAIADILGEDPAKPLLRQLLSFSIGVRRDAFTSAVTSAITDALRKNSWGEDQLAEWERIKEIFWALVSQWHVKQAAKAIDLSFDYTNLFQKARILTDLRPIFEDGHSALAGAVIRHVLRLSYWSTEGAARAESELTGTTGIPFGAPV
jgi:hypothetical protein